MKCLSGALVHGVAVLAFVALGAFLTGCTSSPRFAIRPQGVSQDGDSGADGGASYYADEYNGKKTASGEVYDMNALTAAHRTLPFNSKVKVTNIANGKSVVVRINDRGPFKPDRIIDLSLAAAKEIGIVGSGTGRVHLDVIELGTDTAGK